MNSTGRRTDGNGSPENRTNMQNQIFQTKDTALATTLATLGVPFAKNDSGQLVAFLNVYDPGILKKLGYKGWKMLAAAKDAHAKRRPGVIHYQFEKTPLLLAVVEAFNTRQAQIKDQDFARTAPAEDIDIEPAVAARFACQLMNNRFDLINAWQTAVPMLSVPGETSVAPDPEKPGVKVVTGSCRLVSINASPETLAHLGL